MVLLTKQQHMTIGNLNSPKGKVAGLRSTGTRNTTQDSTARYSVSTIPWHDWLDWRHDVLLLRILFGILHILQHLIYYILGKKLQNYETSIVSTVSKSQVSALSCTFLSCVDM